MIELIHPRMLSKLVRYFPSILTIQESLTETVDDNGHATLDWTDVNGLVGLHCNKRPVTSNEVRTSDLVISHNAFRVSVLAYIPSVTTRMQAVIDGKAYNILGVESDSLSVMTYLTVEAVTL